MKHWIVSFIQKDESDNPACKCIRVDAMTIVDAIERARHLLSGHYIIYEIGIAAYTKDPDGEIFDDPIGLEPEDVEAMLT